MNDKRAGYWLLERAVIAGPEMEIVDCDHETFDSGGSQSKITLKVTEEDIQWCAFGLIYSIAVLSFADARPRGMSDIDFEDDDEFSVKDFFECLHYEYGQIRFHADYIRGRCMKTSITAEKDGTVKIGTVNRGEVASRWVDKLKGKKLMQIVKDQNGQQ
jgi:hypothetical protein